MKTIKIKLLLFFYSLVLIVAFGLRLTFLFFTLKWQAFKDTITNSFKFCNKKSINNKQFIWFHTASVGESLLAFPLVKELLQKKTSYQIVVTTCTKSSKDLWEKEFKDKILHCYLPWDLKFFAKKFIKYFNLKLAIFIEADFWPNFLFSLKQSKIPALLFNGRMSEKSFKRWLNVSFFITEILKSFTFLSSSSLKSKKHMEHFVGKDKVHYLGNLKYSAIATEVDSYELQEIQQSVLKREVFLAISTHHPEELMLAKLHIKLKKIIPNLLTVIIPRHVERTDSILYYIKQLPVKIQLFSEVSSLKQDTDIYIIDAFGKTSLFCEVAQIAYIGKSMFKEARGGHNLLEPMKKGVVTFFGPYMDNFREITELALEKKVAMQVFNPEELEAALPTLLNNNQRLKEMSSRAKDLALSEIAVKDKYFNIIEKFLTK